MKIALCQINPIIGDFEYNISLILKDVDQALEQGCSLAIFPELSLVGYPPKDLLERPEFISETLRRLDRLASQIKGIDVLCGYVDRNPSSTGKPLVNAVALLSEGHIHRKGGKRLLPTYDVFDEARYFEPSQESLLFELEGQKIGVTICEDIWNVGDINDIPRYLSEPVADLKERGLDLLVNISASPFGLGKVGLRQELIQRIAAKHNAPVLFCNQAGGNDDLLFDGSSIVVDNSGNIVLKALEFEPDLITWDSNKTYPPVDSKVSLEEESLLKGLVMGTKDYVNKCGFKKVLIGLSGGIDSSLVAVIAQMALGPHNVMGIGMPSPYTSQMSREDSSLLAKNLHINFEEIPINSVFDSYKDSLSKLFKGLKEDETEENIQARIRGNLLMALSNKFNAMLLTTGNKSEMAMGYCTLYGDMSGGLAVIADVPKTLCYGLARYINRDKEIIPERVIIRPPSAELRPDQTDQDSLPPYEILDEILDAAVVKMLGFDDIVAMGHAPETVDDVLRRLRLNEYKRLQAPPGLKVTSKAFGYGRRYPIARGPLPF